MDGSVVTWGSAEYGGDCSRVQDQLKNVKDIKASWYDFVAILADGSVVTWGDPGAQPERNKAPDQLEGVQEIQATSGAFAALMADRSVVTWGDRGIAGDPSRGLLESDETHPGRHMEGLGGLPRPIGRGPWM